MDRNKGFSKLTSLLLSVLLAVNCLGWAGFAFAGDKTDTSVDAATPQAGAESHLVEPDATSGATVRNENGLEVSGADGQSPQDAVTDTDQTPIATQESAELPDTYEEVSTSSSEGNAPKGISDDDRGEEAALNESPIEEESTDGEAKTPEEKGTRSTTSTNLDDFLVEAIFDAPVDENGAYIINPNSSYEMTLRFAENEEIQFDDEETLVYNLPSGIMVSNVGPTAFSITVIDENGTAVVDGNSFEVVDGQLLVRFNQENPNFSRLKAMPNVSFDIAISSRFDQSFGEIAFNANVIKDFVFEEKSDLTIDKSVVYDMDSDTARYTLTVTSEGPNENMVIEDSLTGTALDFNQDVVVESSMTGVLSVEPDYDAIENGFRLTIPQMTDGEILTLHYSAAVDNTKISYNGSVEQTNNTARAASDQVPDGKEASADFAGQVKFHRISKAATGDPVQIEEGLYEQTWTVLVNQDHKVEAGGTDIDDWIVQNSRPFMRFSGDGLTINVTFEDGATQTRIVPWGDLYLWQNSDGIWGWRYTTPESDGKASYEIVCKAQIKTEGALGDLTLVNGAQFYGSYEEAQTTIGGIGESGFGIRKDAVSTSSTESEWQITITVPGSGLSDLRIVDDMPKLEYDGQTYVDTYIPDSMQIDGLLEEESWELLIGSSERSFTVTFYQAETQNDANKGILPTPDGQPREISIRYKTAVNQDWLNLASENGYASSQLYRHRNYACAWSGSYRTETVNASVVPIKPDLVKGFVERSEVEIDGMTYPVFRYSLALLGPVEDGAIIQDDYNTEYLKFYDAAGVQIRGWSNSTQANENGTAATVDTSDGMEITVSSFPKQDDGSFYPYYTIHYSLIAKDQESLSEMNSAAASSQGGIDLENTATWGDLSSSRTVNYTYFPYVDKELLTKPTADNGYIAEFKVIINKYAEDLDPTSDTLTIQDELSSNLRLIPDSLTISPESGSITVQHDIETNTLTFEGVPDEKTFEITYQARILGSGNVTYSNTVKFGNFEKTIEEDAVVESSGTGSASNPSITLVKRDSENLSTTLAGATFQLFYIRDGIQVPVIDGNGQNVTFTTGDDGKVLIVGNLQNLGWTLWAGRTYCLVEMEPPSGYELNPEPTYFVLTTTPSNQAEFDIAGDQLNVNDEAVNVSVPVTKNWGGPIGTDVVVVHLLANGNDTGKTITLSEAGDWTGTFDNLRKYDDAGIEISYSVEEEPVDGYRARYDATEEGGWIITNISTATLNIPVSKSWVGPAAGPVAMTLFADGEQISSLELSEENGWAGTFEGLPVYDVYDGHEIAYDVQETPVTGYSSSRSGTPKTGFAFTNTIEGKVSVPVTKTWVGPPSVESVAIHLYTMNDDGSWKVWQTVELDETCGWQHTFEDLDKYDEGGNEIEWKVTEEAQTSFDSTVNEEDGGFVIANLNNARVSVAVEKRWIGPAADNAIVHLHADGEVRETAELSESNGWKHEFTELPKYHHEDGHEIVYTVEEQPIEGYEQSVSGNVVDGFTLVNVNVETTSVKGLKTWNDADNKDGMRPSTITIRLIADGTEVERLTVTATEDWTWSFEELAKYDATDGHEISYSISEDPVSGYTTSISGDAEKGFVVTNSHEPKTATSTPDTTATPTGKFSMAKTGDGTTVTICTLIALIIASLIFVSLSSTIGRDDEDESDDVANKDCV